MCAAGAPSHFPDVAVPGGVRATVDRTLISEAESALEALAETVVIKEVELLATPDAPDAWTDIFDGLDIAVVVDKRGISPRDAQCQLLADTVAWAKRVLSDGELLGDRVCDLNAATAIENADFEGHRSGVGMIDGSRGLLVHRYTAGLTASSRIVRS